MRKFISLFKVQLLGFNSLNGSGKRKKRAKGVAANASVILLIAAAIVFFGYTYARMFGVNLQSGKALNKLLPLMLGISVYVNFFLSFFSATNSLFVFKDYELLSALPVKRSVVVLAKFINMYARDLFFTACILAPTFAVYSKLGGTVSAVLVLKYVAIVLFSPFFAIAASVIVGVVFSAFSSLFRRKNIVNIILLLLFMLGIFAASFISGLSFSGTSNGYIAFVEKIYFFTPWLVKVEEQPLYLLWFVLVNFACFIAVYAPVTVLYGKLNALFTARKKVKGFKLREYTGKSTFSALLNREFKRLFSCPIYALNSMVGAVMGVVAVAALAIVLCITSDGAGLPAQTGDFFISLMPSVFSFLFVLSPTTACSVSLEGTAFWVVKTAPVDMKTYFNAKLALNAVFYVPCAIFVSLVMAIIAGTSFVTVFLCVLSATLIALFGGSLGLLYNLLFPKFKWENETQVVKQGLPCFLTVITAFVMSGLFVLAATMIKIPSVWILFIITAFLFVANILVYSTIMNKGEKMIMKKL